MRGLPICNRLIRSLHETLLAGVRGQDKSRGQFREIQNYIAIRGQPTGKLFESSIMLIVQFADGKIVEH